MIESIVFANCERLLSINMELVESCFSKKNTYTNERAGV